MRAVFHEQDDAEAVVVRLRREGWDAMVVRDRFAGEDDDEDHAWAVLTDAPETMLELLTEGMTNRQIAERLVLSEHTVHRHVANILRKLDAPSRAAAVGRNRG